MADNITLNAGTGGATMRTYADSAGVEHPASVAVYLTTVAAGANVVQEVTPSTGLPVAQQGVWTVQPGNTANTTPWLVSIQQDGHAAIVDASGRMTVNAVQSGSWVGAVTTVDTITNPVAVTQSGTWNAGIVAGSNLIGKASAGADTSTIYDGTTALTPRFAKIAASSSGDNVVVAAVTGKKIRVVEWGLTASGAVGIKWRSNTTDLTGVRPLIQYASAGGSYSPIGRFETAVGEALNLNLSAAASVGGDLAYIEV